MLWALGFILADNFPIRRQPNAPGKHTLMEWHLHSRFTQDSWWCILRRALLLATRKGWESLGKAKYWRWGTSQMKVWNPPSGRVALYDSIHGKQKRRGLLIAALDWRRRPRRSKKERGLKKRYIIWDIRERYRLLWLRTRLRRGQCMDTVKEKRVFSGLQEPWGSFSISSVRQWKALSSPENRQRQRVI